ncbi:spermidine synthase [Ancylobacter amanitiformis]|uniref:Spermidine synthase n=1 Tax=Ancylobacter amanitiformis TaxID=217069 RepID=A0ABU0LRY2_9HYPH|nr:spermidine synthase [Ancylobacter amanitiformis]MDQ0511472.1 spermidine synthase [Ancylobacter amanitiformis]
MIPWSLIDTAKVPDGFGDLRLMRRGDEFSIMTGATELMNSRLSGSEKALATLVCGRLREGAAPRLLIGGLGMGFTLRAALGELGPQAQVVVAELVPAVIAWARGPMAAIFGTSLDDSRVSLFEGDVAATIRAGRAAYDAILLDVDNGPGGLTRAANDGLYSPAGLAAARAALRPGGILAVWSSAPDSDFTGRLRRSGFAVEEARVRANGKGGGARHVIWLAAKVEASAKPAGDARPPRARSPRTP